MIPIQTIRGTFCWINPRHITEMTYYEISDYMYKHYEKFKINMPDGITHYTEVRTVHGREYEVNATVMELLKLIQPYLGGE